MHSTTIYAMDSLENQCWEIIRRHATSGEFYASAKTVATELQLSTKAEKKNLLRLLATPYVVRCLLKRFVARGWLIQVGTHEPHRHGTPYLLLRGRKASDRSIKSRIQSLRRKLQLLLKKRSENKQDNTRYGADYRAERRNYRAQIIALGSMPCTRCGKPVFYYQEAHLDHVDGSDSLIAGWAHPRCNRRHQWRARFAEWFMTVL